MTRPHSPVDEDLQRLYDEVWAGLDRMEESPSLPPLPPKPSAILSASEPEYDEPPLSPTTSSSSHAHRYATLPPGAAKPIMPSIALESLARVDALRDDIRRGRIVRRAYATATIATALAPAARTAPVVCHLRSLSALIRRQSS
ncbi:hypothetical protein FISHEDRAFT_72166 [Fistulina hepatica ATCC 64428]|uniref:Uncharacterized protein n=1 Tax=Fistulina hepatica ATCC 64428 TaxID=1128425 RepID=A0A0D7AF28_9AGAR|nr:hypothetical protein FISHEDRAFT_72166 [Fistulina hepatica ATCC 64428]